jgi:hypothetical protein
MGFGGMQPSGWNNGVQMGFGIGCGQPSGWNNGVQMGFRNGAPRVELDTHLRRVLS